ncbi:hypothetical protein HYZ05_01370 [Candidatus Daviesbacteria bacterium]|nr:hypothetical protein [Candidatus Daviesbacteria bacterium]
MVDATSTEKEPGAVSTFKEVLLQSAFSRGRAISDSISEIELGIFANEGRELVSLMMRDPRRREFGKLVYVTNERKVLLQDKPTAGDENSVSHSVKMNILIDNTSLPWYLRQDRMIAASLHSHPEDISPSSEDLQQLLLGDFDYSASSVVFVSSAKRNFVIFRGKNTPQFTREQVYEKIALWERSIKERVIEFTIPYMSNSAQMETNNKARLALLRQAGKKYDLKIFVGEADSTRVSLLL